MIVSSKRQRASAQTVHSATGQIEIKSYRALLEALRRAAARIQQLARKNYRLWRDDQNHRSLGFKPLKGGSGKRFSIRVGDHYRAIGQRLDDGIEWVWIGSHEDYNKL